MPNLKIFECYNLDVKVKSNVSLKQYSTFEIGGKARFFTEVNSINELFQAVKYAKENNLAIFILGRGSNILVSDYGFNGLVIKINIKGIERSDLSVLCCAGEIWDDFVLYTINCSLCGLENLSGIPGTVGASPIQNIGAYQSEAGDFISKVIFLDISNLNKPQVKEFVTKECGFSYRNSVFKKDKDKIVLAVEFRLKKGFKEELETKREEILSVRREKSMVLDKNDPNTKSVGSFFINPVISKEEFIKLNKIYTNIPNWKVEGGVKLAAAWLIEQAGFTKGYTIKNVGLSDKHTLCIVNKGSATANEIISFARVIRDEVKHKFNVSLIPEVNLVGFPDNFIF